MTDIKTFLRSMKAIELRQFIGKLISADHMLWRVFHNSAPDSVRKMRKRFTQDITSL